MTSPRDCRLRFACLLVAVGYLGGCKGEVVGPPLLLDAAGGNAASGGATSTGSSELGTSLSTGGNRLTDSGATTIPGGISSGGTTFGDTTGGVASLGGASQAEAPLIVPSPSYANAVYIRTDGQMATLVVGQDLNLYEVRLYESEPANVEHATYLNLNLAAGCPEALVSSGLGDGGYAYPGWVSPYVTSEGENAIVYTSPSGLVELTNTGPSNWTCSVLRNSSFAANRRIASPAFGYVRSNGTNAILFVADNLHVWEVTRDPGATLWYWNDLNVYANDDSRITGSASAYVRANGVNSVLAVNQSDKHIHEMWLTPGQAWSSTDLTNAARCKDGVPAPPSDDDMAPIASARVDGINVIHYRCNGGHICEISDDPVAWCWKDLFEASVDSPMTPLAAPLVPGSDRVNWNFGSGESYTLFYSARDPLAGLSYISGLYLVGNQWRSAEQFAALGQYDSADGWKGCFPVSAQTYTSGKFVRHVLCNGKAPTSAWNATYDLWASGSSSGIVPLVYSN